LIVIVGLLFAFLIFPYLGLFNYDGFGGNVTKEMIFLYSFHIFIEIGVILFGLVLIKKIQNIDYSFIKYNLKSIMNLSIFILIIVILINLFVFGNYHILLRDIGRGEFRTTLHVGFIYSFLSFYLPGGILALNSYLYSQYFKLGLAKKFKNKLLLLFILAMFIGFSTGFKATAIIIALMGLAGMSSIIKFRQLIVLGGLFITIMTVSGYLFMNFNDFGQVLYYLFKRATSIAVDGTVGVYNLFPDGGKDSYLILLYTLGNNLASLIYGFPKDSLEFLQINLGRLIGYLTYPPEIAQKAVSGAFNLTITNFGEAIYLLGKNYFYFYTLLVSIAIITLLYLYKKAKIDLKIILIVYFFTSVVIRGGVFTNIFAITTFVYLSVLYVVIKSILLYGRYKIDAC